MRAINLFMLYLLQNSLRMIIPENSINRKYYPAFFQYFFLSVIDYFMIKYDFSAKSRRPPSGLRLIFGTHERIRTSDPTLRR